jgi:cell division protein FtsZ
MPSSLVKEALANAGVKQPATGSVDNQQAPAMKAEQPTPASAPVMSATDEELLKIAAQLNVCIKIIGCGGGGCNTINRCVDAGISGAQLCAINTDAKHLLTIRAPKKILIGKSKTRGLGAGARPEVGEESARENDGEIRDFLNGSNIVFITAGMGGGTGTGAAHYVAAIAKDGPHGERIVRTGQTKTIM